MQMENIAKEKKESPDEGLEPSTLGFIVKVRRSDDVRFIHKSPTR